MRGCFITLEGGEGVGKSTQVAAIRELLVNAGRQVVVTREPGGTPRAEQLRALLLDKTSEAMPEICELLLMFAARSTHLANVIEPALVRGDWVLCDRFTDATFAYQGGGRGVDTQVIAWLEQQVQKALRPDLTVLLDAPIAVTAARAAARNQARGSSDRFEDERLEFFARVRAAYLKRAAAEPARIVVVDATPAAEVVTAHIATAIQSRLGLPHG